MLRMNARGAMAAAIAAAAVLLGGCASSGMGGGEIYQKGRAAEPVLFSWKSNDGSIDGTMTATLPNATYHGPLHADHAADPERRARADVGRLGAEAGRIGPTGAPAWAASTRSSSPRCTAAR